MSQFASKAEEAMNNGQSMYDAAAEKRMRELRAEVRERLREKLPQLGFALGTDYEHRLYPEYVLLDFALPIAMELEATKQKLIDALLDADKVLMRYAESLDNANVRIVQLSRVCQDYRGFANTYKDERDKLRVELEAKTRECEAYIRTLKSISSMWTHDGSVGDHAISLYAARNMANYVLHNNETQ
jgi:hypothetical protein